MTRAGRAVDGLAVLACVVLAPATASATDVMRPPQIFDILARPGHPDELMASTSFGTLSSDDGGDTWRWLCENAVGYGGNYDPDYIVTETGAVLATTFEGVRINRDACSFATSPIGTAFASDVALASDGTIHVALAFPGDSFPVPPLPADRKLHRSYDDGVTFDAGLEVGPGNVQWSSLEVAPGDPDRIYLTGKGIDDGALYLFRSDDGGDSYLPLSVAPFIGTSRSDLTIAVVSPFSPNHLLARLSWWNPDGSVGDAFYHSGNSGQSWQLSLQTHENARGILFREGSGDVVIATQQGTLYNSVDAGWTFSPVPGPHPEMYCLRERPDGTLWACTKNFAEPPFDYGVMATTDLTTWTGVMRYQDDIVGPVDCADGTIQHDCCVYQEPTCMIANPSQWCLLVTQLQVGAEQAACEPDPDPDPDPDPTDPGGCCGAGSQPAAAGLLALIVAWALGRRRRAIA